MLYTETETVHHGDKYPIADTHIRTHDKTQHKHKYCPVATHACSYLQSSNDVVQVRQDQLVATDDQGPLKWVCRFRDLLHDRDRGQCCVATARQTTTDRVTATTQQDCTPLCDTVEKHVIEDKGNLDMARTAETRVLHNAWCGVYK